MVIPAISCVLFLFSCHITTKLVTDHVRFVLCETIKKYLTTRCWPQPSFLLRVTSLLLFCGVWKGCLQISALQMRHSILPRCVSLWLEWVIEEWVMEVLRLSWLTSVSTKPTKNIRYILKYTHLCQFKLRISMKTVNPSRCRNVILTLHMKKVLICTIQIFTFFSRRFSS